MGPPSMPAWQTCLADKLTECLTRPIPSASHHGVNGGNASADSVSKAAFADTVRTRASQ